MHHGVADRDPVMQCPKHRPNTWARQGVAPVTLPLTLYVTLCPGNPPGGVMDVPLSVTLPVI